LVAVDPCPTLGDPPFDAIDLIFWRAGDLDTISRRAEVLAAAIGTPVGFSTCVPPSPAWPPQT